MGLERVLRVGLEAAVANHLLKSSRIFGTFHFDTGSSSTLHSPSLLAHYCFCLLTEMGNKQVLTWVAVPCATGWATGQKDEISLLALFPLVSTTWFLNWSQSGFRMYWSTSAAAGGAHRKFLGEVRFGMI